MKSDRGLVVIAVFKLAKAVLLVGAGLGALKLIGRQPTEALSQVISLVHFDPHGRIAQRLIGRIGVLSEKQLAAVAFGTFAYAAVFLVEGVGLLLRKRWAEWLTVIVTASFVPIEIWELTRHFSAVKVMALALNLAIVAYLAVRLRQRN